jgi:hypothetical protein
MKKKVVAVVKRMVEKKQLNNVSAEEPPPLERLHPNESGVEHCMSMGVIDLERGDCEVRVVDLCYGKAVKVAFCGSTTSRVDVVKGRCL